MSLPSSRAFHVSPLPTEQQTKCLTFRTPVFSLALCNTHIIATPAKIKCQVSPNPSCPHTSAPLFTWVLCYICPNPFLPSATSTSLPLHPLLLRLLPNLGITTAALYTAHLILNMLALCSYLYFPVNKAIHLSIHSISLTT